MANQLQIACRSRPLRHWQLILSMAASKESFCFSSDVLLIVGVYCDADCGYAGGGGVHCHVDGGGEMESREWEMVSLELA